MSYTLVSSTPFSFSATGPYEGLPLTTEPSGYPYGGFGTISWSTDLRFEDGSGNIDDVTLGAFMTRPPGTAISNPAAVSDDGPVIVDTFVTTGGVTITTTTTFGCVFQDDVGTDNDFHFLNGNIHVLVEADAPLTIHVMDEFYGGFACGWDGFDVNVSAQWDPQPRFSENPGVDDEVALNTGDYAISYFNAPTSSEWNEDINLIIPPGTVDGDGAGDGVTDDDVTLRVWTYTFDGHDYYVLRVGQAETLVYDLTTGTWSQWQSPGRANWRAHVGSNWAGMSAATLDRGFGSDVVAGDDASGVLWVLDPTTGRDDRSTTGDDAFNRVVIGGLEAIGRQVIPCNAVQLDMALGSVTQVGAIVTLETSDDFGHTWTDHGSLNVVSGAFNATVEWRALGTIRAPGRIFRITDNGATVRISGADMR